MDCNPIVGSCPGHPGGTHSGGRDIDVAYYTYCDNNFTQWNPDGERNSIVTNYKDPNSPIDENVFDWRRQWVFFKRVRQLFPDARFGVDYRIVDYFKRKFSSQDDHRYIRSTFIGDHPSTNYFHHGHTHMYIRQKNFEFKISDFYRLEE